MDYIIDPMWFYWLQVVDDGKFLSGVVGLIGGVIAAAIWLWAVGSGEVGIEEGKRVAKVAKRYAVMFCLIFIIGIFIPSKQTLIEMEIAKHATYSNVESIKEQITDAADYILDRLEGRENK